MVATALRELVVAILVPVVRALVVIDIRQMNLVL